MVMEYDLRKYVKVYDMLSEEECSNVLRDLESNSWGKHSYHQNSTNDFHQHNDEFDVSYNYGDNTFKLVSSKLHESVVNYIKGVEFEWFTEITGISPPRFNKYSENTQMRNHCDHIHSLFDGDVKGVPILTFLGSLNNDYDGGELVFFDSEIIKLTAGQIMVFPSNFLYPHRVEPVKSGTRYSYVSWGV
jgi:predicted 2-oxoglutarate/Fe(II)-dependent dioxygenase YbiX